MSKIVYLANEVCDWIDENEIDVDTLLLHIMDNEKDYSALIKEASL